MQPLIPTTAAHVTILSCALVVGVAGAGEQPTSDATIIIATGSFGNGGSLVSMQRTAPWSTVPVASLDSPDATVQSFAGRIYVVEPSTDLIRVLDADGVELRSISVGAGTSPRDILGVTRTRAYVTRAGSRHLHRLDPQTGVGTDIVDLGRFADEDGIPEMERMATDGSRLFIQLRRLSMGASAVNQVTGGAIAVLDLATESLIDADPSTPEVDAIELLGPAPRLRMHVDPLQDLLLVSATDGNHLNFDGGIEHVDLATLSSAGFILAESDIAALGGFTMTEAAQGYFLFHTDIIPSNHLTRFTISGGAEIMPDIVFDAGAYLDALLFDPMTGLLFMPATAGGFYVVDTAANTPVMPDPIPLPGFPVDAVIGPIGNAFDLTGDGVVGAPDLLELIASWGDCPAPCPPTCVADIAGSGAGPGADCHVDVADLLLLLANWSR